MHETLTSKKGHTAGALPDELCDGLWGRADWPNPSALATETQTIHHKMPHHEFF